MKLKELRNQVNAILSIVAPRTRFYVSQMIWQHDENAFLELTLYPEEGGPYYETVKFLQNHYDESGLIRNKGVKTPAEMLKRIKAAVEAYQKQSNVNYKTIELDEEPENIYRYMGNYSDRHRANAPFE